MRTNGSFEFPAHIVDPTDSEPTSEPNETTTTPQGHDRRCSLLAVDAYPIGRGGRRGAQKKRFAGQMKDLSQLNSELGLAGGYQNHSGKNYIGGSIWDFWMMIKDLDPATIGFSFDIGQAMVEGSLSWPTQVRLTRDRWVALQVKDFNWVKTSKNQWKPQWCPLGKGRLQKAFFKEIKSNPVDGPIIQHCEHIRPGGPIDAIVAGLTDDFQALKKWLS